MGGFQLCDVTASSRTMVTEFLSCSGKSWPPYYLLLHIVTFMLQPLKMQGEARNCEKRRFGTLRMQLCALRSQDQLEILTNCLLLLATHSDFYASTLKNTRGS